MKVVLISNYRIGAETGTARICEELAQFFSEHIQILYICLGEKLEIQKINKNLIYLKIPSFYFIRGYIPVLTYNVKKTIEKELDVFSPDIIHAHNIVYSASIALEWSIKKSVPYVLTFHYLPAKGVEFIFLKNPFIKILKKVNTKLNERYTNLFLNSVRVVITQNRHVEKSIRAINKKVPFVRINNGINLASFLRINKKTISKVKKLVYIGSYIPRKNQEYLLKAVQHLHSKIKLNLYGNTITGRKYIKVLKRKIAKFHLKNISINGYLKRKKLVSVFQSSDFFVSASLMEVQSLVIIEALASGIPVVSLENETTKDWINIKNGFLLKRNSSPREFARKLENLFSLSNADYRKLSQNARETSKNFDINLIYPKIINIYENVLKGRYSKRKKLFETIEFKELRRLNTIVCFIMKFFTIRPSLRDEPEK